MRRLWVGIAVLVAVGATAGPADAAVPKSCLAALKEAEARSALVSLYGSAIQDHVHAVNLATQAASRNGDSIAYLNAVTDSLGTLTHAVIGLADTGKSLTKDYESAARKCRAGK